MFLSGFLLFLLFVIFSYTVHQNAFDKFDFDNTVKLQDHISRKFDSSFSWLSLIGSLEITMLFLLIFLVILRKLKGIFVLILFGAIHIFELYGKTFVKHLGPPFLFFRYNIDFNFPTSYVQPGYSYPSGHAARTAFISVILFLLIGRSKRFSRNKKIIAFSIIGLFDLTMFVSRVYLGEHWTSDIIGGALLGTSLGILSAAIL